MKSKVFRVLQVGALLMIASAALMAQSNRWEYQVRDQLHDATRALNWAYDLQPSHEVYTVSLRNNTYQDIKYNLEAGETYVFVGVCDNDCSNMHLQLFDGYGKLIDSDTERGGYPVVTTSVGHGGAFYLRVIMHGCAHEPCWGGVGAYR